MTKAELLTKLEPFDSDTEIVLPDLFPIVDVAYIPADDHGAAFVVLSDQEESADVE